MKTPKIDWPQQIANYEKSGMQIKEYCENSGIKIQNFRYHLCKSRRPFGNKVKKSFEEFTVSPELTFALAIDGSIIIQGVDPKLIPAIVQAWSHAVSHLDGAQSRWSFLNTTPLARKK